MIDPPRQPIGGWKRQHKKNTHDCAALVTVVIGLDSPVFLALPGFPFGRLMIHGQYLQDKYMAILTAEMGALSQQQKLGLSEVAEVH